MTFEQASLRRLTFVDSEFSNISFEQAKLFNINFQSVELHEVSFKNAMLERANFQGAAGYSTEQLIEAKKLIKCEGIAPLIREKLLKEKPEIFK